MIALIMCLISVYFGMSIYNANNNELIQHLNQADKIYYYDQDFVPTLNFRAGIFTAPFIMGILVLSFLIYRSSTKRQVKNLALGSIAAVGCIIVFDVITICYPYNFDFSKWGFVWVTLGAIIIWANVLSLFIKET